MLVPVEPPTQRSSLRVHHRMAAMDAASGTVIIRSTTDGRSWARLAGDRSPRSASRGGDGQSRFPATRRAKAEFSGSTTQSCGSILLQPHVAADGRAGPAGAGTDDDPGRHWERLATQLGEHRLGDVVVAAPVGCPFGIGELVQVVPTGAGRQIRSHLIDLTGSATR